MTLCVQGLPLARCGKSRPATAYQSGIGNRPNHSFRAQIERHAQCFVAVVRAIIVEVCRVSFSYSTQQAQIGRANLRNGKLRIQLVGF